MATDPNRVPTGRLPSLWIVVAVAVTFVAGVIRWGPIQTIVVLGFIGILLVGALSNKPRNMAGAPGATWLALTLVGLSPVAFGLLIFVITPTYFRPLYANAQGWATLAGFGVAVILATGAAQLAIRAFRHGQGLAGAALSTLTAICVLPALLFVILGPPIAVLLRPAS